MFGLTAQTQKILGYSIAALGVIAGGVTVYKIVKKKKKGNSQKALQGVNYRRQKNNAKKRKNSQKNYTKMKSEKKEKKHEAQKKRFARCR